MCTSFLQNPKTDNLRGLSWNIPCMWPRTSNVLAPMTYVDSGPKGRKIFSNSKLEVTVKDINYIIFAETVLYYHYWNIFHYLY